MEAESERVAVDEEPVRRCGRDGNVGEVKLGSVDVGWCDGFLSLVFVWILIFKIQLSIILGHFLWNSYDFF